MYNVLGVIAEYNPLHNGHLYHISESKKLCNSDFAVCIMSGNFVQRGDSSLINKWTKTEMALLNGFDLVIELPTVYATSSAENFAEGAIKILNAIKIVDSLSFGSETTNIDNLIKIASVLYNEPKEYSTFLNNELHKGISYPKARENALLMYLNNDLTYSDLISQPNNILGIEYLKALKKTKSSIKPYSIKREKVYYNDKCIIDEYASSTAIRDLIKHDKFDEIRNVMPRNSYYLLNEDLKKGNYVPDISKYEKEIIYNLRKMSILEIRGYPDVSEGLEYALKNAANSCNNLYDLITIVKSKRYTQTRIQRILLHILLNIKTKDIQVSRKVTPYVRVLGFNNSGRLLLSEITKRNPKLQIITSVKKFIDSSPNKILFDMLQKDIFATNVYTLGYKHDSWANLDYTNKLITL